MTIGGMTITWAAPSATPEQWAVLAIVVAMPVIGCIGEHVVRSVLRWIWRGGV